MAESMFKSLRFSFPFRIVQNGASVGIFDKGGGNFRPQLVVATETHKIILQNTESVFHVNEPITVLDVYQRYVGPENPLDVVLIGTHTSLMAFDVYDNKTLFHKDMPEGVNCLKVGKLDNYFESVIMCGCGTTIWAFGIDGSDVFWTALGDDVTALEVCDLDGDGNNELIIGSKGTEIKIFKNLGIWNEFDEGDSTVALRSIGIGMFAFGLSSGVVGVYSNGERMWRVKTKSRISGLLVFPDPSFVACVWDNGKVDIRSAHNGEINNKEQLEVGAAAAFLADLNGEGQPQLIVVFRSGQVRSLEFRKEAISAENEEERVMREFNQRKHNLLKELKDCEQRRDVIDAVAERSMVPAGTVLNSALDLTADRELCLRLALNNEVPIRAVLLFAEGIFASECCAIHPNGKESSDLTVHFMPTRNVLTELFIKVFAGYSVEKNLQVFEVNQVLPKFVTCVQTHIDENLVGAKSMESFVEFNLQSRYRPDQLKSWFAENFTFIDAARLMQQPAGNDEEPFKIRFLCLRNALMLQLEVKSSGEAKIYHEDIQNCGDLIQSLAAHLGIKDLKCKAHFPHLLSAISATINTMQERYDISDRLSSEFAEHLNRVRECVVMAEDCLAIRNFADARRLYTRSAMLNRDLITQKTIRMNARRQLLDSLKGLNASIEQFSRLRVGLAQSKLIQECRRVISEENMSLLPRFLEHGV